MFWVSGLMLVYFTGKGGVREERDRVGVAGCCVADKYCGLLRLFCYEQIGHKLWFK